MREGVVSSTFFRVDGADSETGQETFLVLRAKSKPHAQRLARRQGLLITSVRVAKPADWEEAPQKATRASVVEIDITKPLTGQPPTASSSLSPSAPLAQLPAPSQAAMTSTAAPSAGAATIVLCAVGAALIVGGALALALALWPDDGVRNEL